MISIKADYCYCADNNKKIYPYLLHFYSLAEVLKQNKIVKIKVYAKQHHKHGNNPLNIG